MSDDNDDQMELDLGITKDNGTFTIDVSSISDYSSDFGSYTVGPVDMASTIDTSFTFNTNFEEFVDTMPSMHKIKGMCEQYPAFNIEFQKFKQMYNLIKDDFEANNENDIPF